MKILCQASGAIVLLLSLVITSSCDSSKPGPSEQPSTTAQGPARGELTSNRSCLDSTKPIGKTKIDFDRDGTPETEVDLFQIDFKYPIAARWRTGEAGGEIWAVATHLIVTLRPGISPGQTQQELSSRLDGRDLQVVPLTIPQTYLVGLMPSSTEDDEAFRRQGGLLKALPDLRSMNSVEAVEPDYIFTLDGKPNDRHFGLQDDLKKIRAPEAWDFQTGSRGIRVAVIDSGIDAAHDDLKDNIGAWKDFVNGSPKPYDDNGHGTQCSGLIGAKGNNQIGIAGVNWDVEILPIKAFDLNGCGTGSHAAEAIHFAIDNNAEVISASWGGFTGQDADLIKKEILKADQKGILFVASAGNRKLDLDTNDYVPGTLQLPNLISVSALMNDGKTLRHDSGFGKERVHLSAPGEKVLSTFLTTGLTMNDPFAEINQTSAATALVAGACALVKAEHGALTHHQIRRLILDSTEEIPPGASCSGGRLDLANALKRRLTKPNQC